MTSDELLWAVCWLLVVCAFCVLLLIKGCVCATTCQSMLAECERGLEDMSARLDDGDGGCP